jgi:Dimerisation domain
VNPTSPTPDAILQTAFSFWNSKVLITAVTFDLFTKLGQRRLTGAQIGQELALRPRGIADFLDSLVAMKFLERAGDSAGAKYSYTPTTALYLDRQSPRYIGGILEMLNAGLFKYWHDLPEALRTGQPQNETKHGERSIFDQLYADTTKLEQFLDELRSRQRCIRGSMIPQNGSPEHVLRVDHSGQLV